MEAAVTTSKTAIPSSMASIISPKCRRKRRQGLRPRIAPTYQEWDALPHLGSEQGVSLFRNHRSRLGQARMIQCGPEGDWSPLKRMDTWDERPP
jgi:hypothetical protein